jgi:hypothetical protein
VRADCRRRCRWRCASRARPSMRAPAQRRGVPGRV